MDIQNRLGSPIQIIAIGLPQPIVMLIEIGLPWPIATFIDIDCQMNIRNRLGSHGQHRMSIEKAPDFLFNLPLTHPI